MAVFPSISPTYPLERDSSPNILKAEFGDGYVMAQPNGINSLLRVHTLIFTRIPLVDRNTIDAFLVAHKGTIPFDWTAPGDTLRKWVCESWRESFVEYDQYTIRATFMERAA